MPAPKKKPEPVKEPVKPVKVVNDYTRMRQAETAVKHQVDKPD